jgi:hypothetical protein
LVCARVSASWLCAVCLAWLMAASPASAAAGAVGWSVSDVAMPSEFSAGDAVPCAREGECDRYQLLVQNVGDAASSGPVTVIDNPPAGISIAGSYLSEESGWECNSGALGNMMCTYGHTVAPGAWPDVDWQEKQLMLADDPDYAKSDAARRPFPLIPQLEQLLRAEWQGCLQQQGPRAPGSDRGKRAAGDRG